MEHIILSKKHNSRSKRGFTLVELLVVISIIGLLSTFALISLDNSRKKARDAMKQSDFKNVQTALYLFYDKYGRMPANYNPGWGVCQGDGFYEQSMNELVQAGFLGDIPKAPANGGGYCYYNYGPDNTIGALLVTALETAPSSMTGIAPSCRPWHNVNNWCRDDVSDKSYCICTPY